ncbi:hypothetical protein VM1G_01468 [Cytospora mali]|uniref:Uncharacterized protein n=1 Tax=Cytospora mali TaxID=578113 RepID=A0A194VQZ1_CYTMA|nr:hypothetical protein VM1G_01468 [Valsa mali]
MCIQRTQYSCRHTNLRQLPCGDFKKVKQGRSFFGFKPAAIVPCHRRYDWSLDELCPKCRILQEQVREAWKLGSLSGYATPASSPRSLSVQDSTPRECHQSPTPVRTTRALRPDSYYEPGLNAGVANLPGHYEVSAPFDQAARGPRPYSYYDPAANALAGNLPGHYEVSAPVSHTARGSRPDSYHDPAVNAIAGNLPGHYEVSTSAQLTVPSQRQSTRSVPDQTPSRNNRSHTASPPVAMLSRQHRGPQPAPVSALSSYPGNYAQGDGAVSPVSSEECGSRLVSPLSDAGDVGAQFWQQKSGPQYYGASRHEHICVDSVLSIHHVNGYGDSSSDPKAHDLDLAAVTTGLSRMIPGEEAGTRMSEPVALRAKTSLRHFQVRGE